MVENSVDHEHWRAGAALRILDRAPSRRDDVAFHGGKARTSSVHVAPVAEVETGCWNRDSGSKSGQDEWIPNTSRGQHDSEKSICHTAPLTT